jgi:transglutaminase-like putative cysteine protease
MRLRITHETVFSFETPATYAIQTLRLTPRGSAQQYVSDWRIDVSRDCRLAQIEDPFGNVTTSFSIDGPIEELSIVASGEVTTEETNGVVAGIPERLPLMLYRRDTALTKPSPAIRGFAEKVRSTVAQNDLAMLHGLMDALHAHLDIVDADGEPDTSADDVFTAGKGSIADAAHVFVSAARALEIPARFVSGYLLRDDGAPCNAGHAWAEAYAGSGLGWVGFDPSQKICPTDSYVRMASGLDYLDAAPIRGTRYGGTGETVSVTIRLENAGPF